MDHESVQVWLDKYVEAWRTYDATQITGFAEYNDRDRALAAGFKCSYAKAC